MRTNRGLTVALSTVLALIGILGIQALTLPAAATTPHWQTTASYPPLANVRAVSCAPSISPSSATCVAVGDDGGNVASVLVTNNGGTTWTDTAPAPGVTTLSTVSCPSASVCYAGGGSGIMKSTDGGSMWTLQDGTFPAESISCFTIDECTAVQGIDIVKTNNGANWNSQISPSGTDSLSDVSCSNAITCAAVGVVNGSPAIIGTQDGGTWTTLDQPSVNLLSSLSCSTSTTCVAVGVASGGKSTSLSTVNFSTWVLLPPYLRVLN